MLWLSSGALARAPRAPGRRHVGGTHTSRAARNLVRKGAARPGPHAQTRVLRRAWRQGRISLARAAHARASETSRPGSGSVKAPPQRVRAPPRRPSADRCAGQRMSVATHRMCFWLEWLMSMSTTNCGGGFGGSGGAAACASSLSRQRRAWHAQQCPAGTQMDSGLGSPASRRRAPACRGPQAWGRGLACP